MTCISDIENRSDTALIEACLRGEREAWDTLVDQYQRLVYSIARRHGLSDSDSEDVFQNVFLILYRRLETLRDKTRLSAWLVTTTQRECWRLGERSGRWPLLDERIADVSAPERDDEDRWERQRQVGVAIDQLGGRCRDVLLALFQVGNSPGYERVAEQLGIPVGSIGPTRARSFRKLEAILSQMSRN